MATILLSRYGETMLWLATEYKRSKQQQNWGHWQFLERDSLDDKISLNPGILLLCPRFYNILICDSPTNNSVDCSPVEISHFYWGIDSIFDSGSSWLFMMGGRLEYSIKKATLERTIFI